MTSDHVSDADSADQHLGEPTTEPGAADDARDHTVGDTGREPVDLDRIAADLDGVETALGRLDDGTYWIDEVTGDEIDESVLAADPVARRNPTGA